ncbi:MAG: hypothetical protein ACFFAU_19680 [Candidatus Hodarchaeota archaeon]
MINPEEWEWQAQPSEQTLNGFTFKVPIEKELTGGIFVTRGVYSSHKGSIIEETWQTPLIGELSFSTRIPD